MKPTKGSERAPSKATKGKKPSEKEKKLRKTQENLQPGTSGTVPQPKSKKNKVNAGPRKVNGQEKWKPLSESSITALDKMLALSVLSVLAVQRTGKEESQKHLNILRTRFIAKCAQLAVPFQKQETIGNAFRQHQEESRKAAVGRKNLTVLEADLSAVVTSLEKMEEQRDCLEHQCSNLRKLLGHEEDRNWQVLQLSDQGVLHLPALPPRKHRDTPLQKRLLTLVPGEASTTVARHIAKTLQVPGPLQDARALLEQAYRHADHMLTPAAVSQSQEVSTNPLGQ